MTNYEVEQRFWRGKAGHSLNVRSTGDKLFSYYTCILQRLADDRIVGNVTRYSVSTSKHQSVCGVRGADILVDGIARGTQDLTKYAERMTMSEVGSHGNM